MFTKKKKDIPLFHFTRSLIFDTTMTMNVINNIHIHSSTAPHNTHAQIHSDTMANDERTPIIYSIIVNEYIYSLSFACDQQYTLDSVLQCVYYYYHFLLYK